MTPSPVAGDRFRPPGASCGRPRERSLTCGFPSARGWIDRHTGHSLQWPVTISRRSRGLDGRPIHVSGVASRIVPQFPKQSISRLPAEPFTEMLLGDLARRQVLPSAQSGALGFHVGDRMVLCEDSLDDANAIAPGDGSHQPAGQQIQLVDADALARLSQLRDDNAGIDSRGHRGSIRDVGNANSLRGESRPSRSRNPP